MWTLARRDKSSLSSSWGEGQHDPCYKCRAKPFIQTYKKLTPHVSVTMTVYVTP